MKAIHGVMACGLWLGSMALEAGETGFWLVTEREARAELSAPRMKAAKSAAKPAPDAPKIVVETPDTRTPVKVPVDIVVRFETAGDAEILPETLKVQYGWLEVDLTERLTEHAEVTKKGITAKDVKLPEGDHKLTILVEDSKGRRGENRFEFAVTGP